MRTSESIKTIMPAMLRAQKEITFAAKDAKNTFFNNAKYATLESVISAIKDPLNKHGILIMHSTSLDNTLTTTLMHVESCEFIAAESKLLMKNQDMQSFGSAQTYSKRYHLTALLNLPTEDDDGNLASGPVVKDQGHPVKTEFKKDPYYFADGGFKGKKFDELMPEDFDGYLTKLESLDQEKKSKAVIDLINRMKEFKQSQGKA